MSEGTPSPPAAQVDHAMQAKWRQLQRRYALSPSRWLGGPVFIKEVWTLGKRLSTNWIRLAYGTMLLGLLFIVLSNTWMRGSWGYSPLQALQAYQNIAPGVTAAVLGFQFVALPLMACVFGGGAVCDEVRAGSLGTLLSTPLKAREIVMGKLLGRCSELLILTLIALPILLMLRVLGGVQASAIIGPSAIALANAVLALQISMWMSARVRHSASAIGGGIAVMGMLWVVSFVVLFIVYEVAPKLTTVVPTKALVAISAPASMVMEMVPFMGGGGPPFAHPHWAWHVLFTLCLTALFFWFTTISIRRAMHATALHGPGAGRGFKKKQDNTRKGVVVEAQGSPQNSDIATTTVASSEGQAELHSEGSTKRKRTKSTVVEGISRTVGDNPVLWREFQQRMTRGQWAMPVGTGFCICALLFIYWMASLQEGTQISLAIGGAVLLMVLASLQTTSAISSEREGRTLEVLLTTPLTARQIVWGKMLGACKRILPFLLIIALHLVFSGVIPHITRFIFLPLDHFVKFARFMGNDITIAIDGPAHIRSWRGGGAWAPSFVSPLSIVIMLWVLAVTLFFQLASGIFLSTVMKRSTAAAVTNLLLALVVWLFLPIGLAIIDNDLVETYGAIHPVVLMAIAIEEGTNHSLIHQHFDVPDGGTSFAGFMVCVMLYSAIALVISWGALKLAALEIGFSGGRKR